MEDKNIFELLNSKRIHSSLALAYSPISNYEFYYLKKEGIVQQILSKSTLYIICQREELTFENITYDASAGHLNFEIQKKGSASKLSCSMSLYQSSIEPVVGQTVAVEFGRNNKNSLPITMPANDIKGIRFFSTVNPGEFLYWISPDKFLRDYWAGDLEATIIGDYRQFTNFKVHYVGESTDQDIWQRLTGHEKLQDILTLEEALHYESVNTHEIVLLLFNIENVETVTILNGTENVDTFVNEMINPTFPSKEKITLDAEKALIKILKPDKKYNKIQYKQYPVSKDGLYSEGFDWVSYKISDNITLNYGDVEIIGSTNVFESTTIIVEDNKTLRLKQPTAA